MPPAPSPSKPRADRRVKPSRWNETGEVRDEVHRRKKVALVREAGRAFKKRGFHNTSLDDVAASLNLTKAALYYYIKGKRELLFETQSLALDMGDAALAHGREGTTGLEKVQRTLGKYIELLTDEIASPLVLTDLEDMLPEHQRVIRDRRRRFDTIIRGMVSEGIGDGSIAPCDPKMAVFWFMGSVNAIPRWHSSEGDLRPQEIAATFVALITSGLARHAPPPRKPLKRS